jgi:iron(III) transport system ATP-binding protein
MTHLVLSQLTKRFGDATAVDGIDLSIDDGEAVVLLGPSGCGKTTCLRMIAGFERPDHGEIRLGDRTLAGPGTFVPPERRRMSVVFQSYALWPHMTVDQNVGYGPTTAKVGKAEVRRRVAEALAMVQLPGMGERYVHQLSGGQQQRVALARALVNDPALLLLDEPLSNLDTRLREELRAEVKRIQRSLGVSMLYVTHDQAEALSLADRLVVMNAGAIAQLGGPEEVYRRPRNSYVARALGATNILAATGSPAGRGHLRVLGNVDVATRHEVRGGTDVAVSIRPADVADRRGPVLRRPRAVPARRPRRARTGAGERAGVAQARGRHPRPRRRGTGRGSRSRRPGPDGRGPGPRSHLTATRRKDRRCSTLDGAGEPPPSSPSPSLPRRSRAAAADPPAPAPRRGARSPASRPSSSPAPRRRAAWCSTGVATPSRRSSSSSSACRSGSASR